VPSHNAFSAAARLPIALGVLRFRHQHIEMLRIAKNTKRRKCRLMYFVVLVGSKKINCGMARPLLLKPSSYTSR